MEIHKMKRIETIRKEELKLRKFIKNNIASYAKNIKMRENLNQALLADSLLIWVMGDCKWTPSKVILRE